MKLRRAATWVEIVAVLLIHLVAGIAGDHAQLCVCAGGVTIEQQSAGCCSIEVESTPGVTGGCTDCHLIPLPDAGVASISPAPSLPPIAVMPASVQIAEIVWPVQPALWTVRHRGHPPDPLPRMVRTVVLTC